MHRISLIWRNYFLFNRYIYT